DPGGGPHQFVDGNPEWHHELDPGCDGGWGRLRGCARRRAAARAGRGGSSADVDAHDPAAKLAILGMLGFRRRIEPSQIERVGIRGLDQRQLVAAHERGFVVKLIAAASMTGPGIEADVRPRLIPDDAPLARVAGAMNAISVDAAYAGTLMLQGPGAGPDAAASAVLADLIRAARGTPASAGALLASLADQPVATITPLGLQTPFPAVP